MIVVMVLCEEGGCAASEPLRMDHLFNGPEAQFCPYRYTDGNSEPKSLQGLAIRGNMKCALVVLIESRTFNFRDNFQG